MKSNLAARIRGDFPILSTRMEGKPLVYLDNAATTQKPQAMIDALVRYYAFDNANIHRGAYELSHRATEAFEQARAKVASFLDANSPSECIFVRGTTEAINLVALSWGTKNLKEGDEVLLTGLEHHSNIVPWQMACQRTGAQLKVVQPNDYGELESEELKAAVSPRTKIVSIQHVSNALGTVHNVREIIELARKFGARTLIDGAQWVAHGETSVQELGCDFYTFSGHKLYGPTGIGVLWGRRELLEAMQPYQGGGDMIETVTFDKSTFAPIPSKFEAGTPNIAGAVGLGAAIDYVRSVGLSAIAVHEAELLEYATERLSGIRGLRIIGTAQNKAAVISFVLEEPSVAPLDVASKLSKAGVAVRTGHHCCMPLMGQMGVSGTIRASMAMYNTAEDIDVLAQVLESLVEERRSRKVESSGGEAVDLAFVPASAQSPSEAAENLIEEFLMFDDRESKTELLMEMGQALPHHFEQLKAISAAVPGCMSEVYLIGRPASDDAARIEFVADSNAEVVRGLIAILETIYSGQKAKEILAFDIQSFFQKIGLEQFVSTQRRSGLEGMIRRIHALADINTSSN